MYNFLVINNKNIAYIDGQNLYGGTSETEPKWSIDYKKFRRYLSEKYNVNVAYYCLGFKDEKYQSLYDGLEEAGFELRFREHSASMISNKKGNVDTDIVFDIMYSFIKSKRRRKVVLVSGDGDYIKTVRFLMGGEPFRKSTSSK